MAGVGLLALLDDVATLLDDVAVLSKVAAKKTAGVLGDDLALNAEQVSGVKAEREIPVVWAVAKGSAKNKLILVPAALLISAVIPWLVVPLLMLGGGYLCYEGFEKLAHKLTGDKAAQQREHQLKIQALADPKLDVVAFEKNKIKGAIRTDFILSAEIVVITLGTVKQQPFVQQVVVVSLIAALITVVVYGVVAAIVKLDDAGLYLLHADKGSLAGRFKVWLGGAVLAFCPYLMKTLAVVGTLAMFLVGGGILAHGIPAVYQALLGFEHSLTEVLSLGQWAVVLPTLINALVGVLAGAAIFLLMILQSRLRKAVM